MASLTLEGWYPLMARAVVFNQFGEPADVLSVGDLATRALSAGEVRVRMLASPVNPSDLMTIRGIYGIQPTLPATPGYEGVGVVEAASAGLFGSFLRGKRVAVLNSEGGNWRDQVIVPAKSVIPISSQLPLSQAAMFFVNPATAYLMTRRVLNIPRGAWLLQTAAASAVGRMVIRLGKLHGFRTMNLVRRPEQIDELTRLGADAVCIGDPERETAEDIARRVMDCVGSQGVPFAIDPVGGVIGSAAVLSLGTGGRMLVYGTLSNQPLQFSSRELMSRGSSIEGFWLGRYMAGQSLISKIKLVGELSRGIESGQLDSIVSETFPLQDVAQAVVAAERPGKSGKVILTME